MRKIIIAAAMLAASASQAAFYTGNDLYRFIDSSTTSEDMVSLGYIVGIQDSFNGTLFCTPERVTAGQLQSVVKRWLFQHPEKRHQGADWLTATALIETFPCAKKPTSDKQL